MKKFYKLIPALLLIFYLASFSGCGVNPPCNNCGIDTIPHDTVPTDTVPTDTIPNDTVPQDTVPLPKYYGIWDWIPYPPCIDAKITLTVDSFSNVNVSTYPQSFCHDYHNPCSPFIYYLFCDGEQLIVFGDSLYIYMPLNNTDYDAIFAISSTGYICDTIDVKSINMTFPAFGIYQTDYTFIRRDN